ncbi:MAG: DUF4342 domain-containing protein [Trueperaceae bacterium]|nr:DUF4342 domain-containing protein [Trueperaceae bacterium]
MDQTDQKPFSPQPSRNDSGQNQHPQDGSQQSESEPSTETFRVSGDAVLAKVKELVREGNIRRITLKNEAGRTLLEIPLTIGVVGVLLLPVWAAIGAVAALVANLTITVERHDGSVNVDKNGESTL